MYEQNYPSGQSAPTVDPEPAPNLTEGWLWRKAKITYDKGWYRLRDGELICQGSDRKKDEALGKVSGAVTTSEERLEFTLCAPLATLETARLALPRPMPTLASRPPPRVADTEFKTRSFCFRAESGKEFNRWMAACMLPENFV